MLSPRKPGRGAVVSGEEIHPSGAKERILEAAHKTVGERGLHAASIRDIAKESGVNLALIYYYFESKEGLLLALVHRNAELVAGLLREAAQSSGTPREKILAFGRAWTDIAFRNKRHMASWFRQTIQDPGIVGQTLRQRVALNISLVSGILDDGIRQGLLRSAGVEPRLAAASMILSIMGIAMEMPLPHYLVGADLSTKESREEYLERMVSLFFLGLDVRL